MSHTLNERIDAALYRIGQGLACIRIPADETDPDIVLVACRERIAELESQLSEAQVQIETAEKAEIEMQEHAREVARLLALEVSAHIETKAALREAQARIADLQQMVFEGTGVHPSSEGSTP